ncbi:hypothetical protein Q1695_014514 [Nippostrongylus brasiliensis]|nr:hypothetical protein Q1695_014514 [Nippostrongylus brasiliensis]
MSDEEMKKYPTKDSRRVYWLAEPDDSEESLRDSEVTVNQTSVVERPQTGIVRRDAAEKLLAAQCERHIGNGIHKWIRIHLLISRKQQFGACNTTFM